MEQQVIMGVYATLLGVTLGVLDLCFGIRNRLASTLRSVTKGVRTVTRFYIFKADRRARRLADEAFGCGARVTCLALEKVTGTARVTAPQPPTKLESADERKRRLNRERQARYRQKTKSKPTKKRGKQ